MYICLELARKIMDVLRGQDSDEASRALEIVSTILSKQSQNHMITSQEPTKVP